MARVFVSHAGADLALACEVHGWLVDAGHEVFLDRDLRDGLGVGERWEQRLYEWLRWADAVVCVVTSAYLASPWCTAEVGAAQARGSRLLPVRAERGVVHPLLASTQHTDYVADPDRARAALREGLRQVDLGWPPDRSPFPGLRPFEADRHRVFFGRAAEVTQLAELLRSPAERAEGAVLLVTGPSGCGKSSLVRAGLLPVMADEPGWRTLPPILPGADPVTALARELAAAARRSGLDWTVEHVHQHLGQRGVTGLVDELLLAAPAGPQQRLLIVVDQFEELLTQALSAARARFAELLRPALSGPVRVVATLRPEFLDALLLDPALAALPCRPYPLRPLRREALRAVIEKPAQLVGIEVDDGLVDRLVEDTDTGEALPLLAFTLAQLADGITSGGRLSHARYDQLGGVRGALTRQADAALSEAHTAGGRSRAQVIAGLLRLVTVDEQGRPTRWRVQRAELPEQVCTELDAFVGRRLLSTDYDNAAVVMGVAHEAFLCAWPPLNQAIAQNVSALRARRTVEHAATDWHDHDRPPARLWTGGQLAAAVTDTGARFRTGRAPIDPPPTTHQPSRWMSRHRQVLVSDRVTLSPTARDFLHASIRHDRRRRRRTITVLSVLLSLALTAAGIAAVQQNRAQQGEQIATARQLLAQADAIRSTDPRTALQLGIAAQHLAPGQETQASLVNFLVNTRYAGTLNRGPAAMYSVAFSPDGRTLALAGNDGKTGTVLLWDLTTRNLSHRLSQPGIGPVFSVAFSLDGHTLATANEDHTVILWDLSDPDRPHRLGQPLRSVPPGSDIPPGGSVMFAPDGHTLATTTTMGLGDTVVLWDITNRTQPHRLGQLILTGVVSSAAFAPHGKTLATATTDGRVDLWDLTDRNRLHRLGQPFSVPIGPSVMVFTPDGRTLVTTGESNTLTLWDLTDRTQPHRFGPSLTGHSSRPFSAAFAPDQHTLISADTDGAVIWWDLTDPNQPRQHGPPLASTGRAHSLALSPNGRALATASTDGTMGVWDLTDRNEPQRVGPTLPYHPGRVFSMAFSDAHTLTTAGIDGKGDAATLWDLTNPSRLRRLSLGDPDPTCSMAFAPDGRTLTIGNLAGGVDNNAILAVLWDFADPSRPRRLGQSLIPVDGPLECDVAFSPDAHTAAVGGVSDTVALWDLTDPARPHRLGQDLTLQGSNPVRSVAFAPDGRTLATANTDGRYGTVTLWDLTDRSRPHPLGEPLTTQAREVRSVAFAPDGRTLATAGDDYTVTLWDLTDRNRPRPLVQPLATQPGEKTLVAFAPDGRTLAAGTGNTLTLWDLSDLADLRAHAVQRACAIAGQGLNRDEWSRYISGLPYQDTCLG